MEYNCAKIAENLVIDGNLDKQEWKNANGVKLVEVVTGSHTRLDTSVKLLWNDEFLYAGFCCEDDYTHATMTEYNDKIYNEDVVEIFLDDDRDLKTYIEIEVSPLNTVLHYYIHNDLEGQLLSFARVDKKVISAVSHENGIWTTEIAIPFSEFFTTRKAPPQKGDVWNINLYRIDRGNNCEDVYSAWSPTGEVKFHKPGKFGKLIFT